MENTIIKPAASGNKNAKIINLEVSKEAKAMYDELMEKGAGELLEEGVFDSILPRYYDRGEQSFPEVKLTNTLDSFDFNGTKVYTLGEDSSDNIVLFIHGGAWTFEIDPVHVEFCDRLAGAMKAKVYMPLYPLAPQHNCNDTYKVISELYSDLAKQGKRLFVMGDSAGANIVLGLMHLIKKSGGTMPKAIALISPCPDMTFSDPEMKKIEKKDPFLRVYGAVTCAKHWAGGKPLDDPLMSAMNADVTGYPKTIIYFGTNDIMYHDGMKFFDKLTKSGVETAFVSADGLFHTFPLYDIPERDIAVRQITEFCK